MCKCSTITLLRNLILIKACKLRDLLLLACISNKDATRADGVDLNSIKLNGAKTALCYRGLMVGSYAYFKDSTRHTENVLSA